MSLLARGRALLQSPHLPLFAALIAALLSLPSLRLGLQTDDYLLIDELRAGTPALELWHQYPAELEVGRQAGRFAWWTGELGLHFVRPLSALSHQLDLALFGESALAMRVVNIALYALLAALAALVYRRVLGAGSTLSGASPALRGGEASDAGLAALLFAIDEAHALTVGWISGRNTLLACVFALAALLLHARSREAISSPRSVGLAALSALCTAAALLSAEIGLTAPCYLLAYALVLDPGTHWQRVRSMLPHALVTLAWGGWYVALGAGIRDAGWYRDLHAAPLDALLQGVLDLPVWLFSQLGPGMASVLTFQPVAAARLACALLLAPLLPLFLPALRAQREARFFALAMLLAIAPLCTTVPQDRVLLGVSFGGLGLIACSVQALAAAANASRYARIGRRVLIAVHLVFAPLLFVPQLTSLTRIENATRELAAALPNDPASEVVVINLPLELLTLYTAHQRARMGLANPAAVHALYAGQSPLTVTRIDARTLEVSAADGWGHAPIEHVFASDRRLRQLANKPVQLRSMTVQVVDNTPDGRPARVRFVFPTALETPARSWLIWRGTRPVPFHPPAIGQQERVPALSLFSAMPS